MKAPVRGLSGERAWLRRARVRASASGPPRARRRRTGDTPPARSRRRAVSAPAARTSRDRRGCPPRRSAERRFQNGLSGSSARTVSRKRASAGPAVLRARLQSHPGSRRRERREVADDRPLRLVLHLRLERPARLEQVSQVARLPAAHLERKGTAGVERAAARRPGRVGNLSSRKVTGDAPARVGLGNRPEERLRVRVLRILVDHLRRADLDDPAEIENRDAVAEELRGREVVRDVEVREVELALEVEHQLEDLRPHAHVEHRDGLVRDEQRGIEDDRPRDHRPLLLSPREVRRVLVHVLLGRREANRC